MATAAGADRVVNFLKESLPDVVAAETEGRGADVIVVAAGVRAAMEGAPALAAIGGRINLLPSSKRRHKIQLDSNLIHYKELNVTGTTACSTRDCRRSIDLINSGRVNLRPLVSGTYSLDRVMDAFGAARAGNVLKVVLHPSERKEGL